MSIDHNTLLKNFQPIIGSYQDVSAIYTKLCSQGQLQKVAHLLSEIYDEEHVFTLTGCFYSVWVYLKCDRASKLL